MLVHAPSEDLFSIRREHADGGHLESLVALRGVSDVLDSPAAFVELLASHCEHSPGDVWPGTSIPKDGAWLISPTGVVRHAGVKLFVSKAPFSWPQAGMRRTTGLAVAHGLRQGLVLVRSEAGTLYLFTAASAKRGEVWSMSSAEQASFDSENAKSSNSDAMPMAGTEFDVHAADDVANSVSALFASPSSSKFCSFAEAPGILDTGQALHDQDPKPTSAQTVASSLARQAFFGEDGLALTFACMDELSTAAPSGISSVTRSSSRRTRSRSPASTLSRRRSSHSPVTRCPRGPFCCLGGRSTGPRPRTSMLEDVLRHLCVANFALGCT